MNGGPGNEEVGWKKIMGFPVPQGAAPGCPRSQERIPRKGPRAVCLHRAGFQDDVSFPSLCWPSLEAALSGESCRAAQDSSHAVDLSSFEARRVTLV